MEIGGCPPLNLTQGQGVNTRATSIGTEVTVTCDRRRQTVLTCQQDRTWDISLPSCSTVTLTSETSTSSVMGSVGLKSGAFSLLFIVWVLGALLLGSLLVLVAVLVSSRMKLQRSRTYTNGQSSVFSISNGRETSGGDNPAFCRADEGCGGDYPCTIGLLRDTPPSYQDVTTGHIITGPVMQSTLRINNRSAAPHSQIGYQDFVRPDSEVCHDQVSLPRAARYVCEYPSCFWEEDPPPPYSAGMFGMVHIMQEQRGSAHQRESREGQRQCVRDTSPNLARAPLAVPTPTLLSPASSPPLAPLIRHL